MNHCVPDFETDEDYSIPTSSSSSSLTRLKKSLPIPEGDMMELLWENGQLVMHSQNQVRSMKNSQVQDDVVIPPENSRENQLLEEDGEEEKETSTNHHELFMGEDEMSSWLHYPTISINDDSSFDRQFYADLVYPPPPSSPPSPIPDLRTPSAASRPPMPPPPPPRREPFQNFAHFSRRLGSSAARESKLVDSKETPKAVELEESRVSCTGQVSNRPAVGGGGRENGMCELTVTSSPGGSGASVSASAEPVHIPSATEDRKRKGREGEEAECQIEDIEFESPDLKKQLHGSTSTKRSRAAEVHNLSERRRRDRINEKMKALQELIPHCNKSDKASMLDEAIEYLKSLQLQVQMMSMGCGMVPMMFPGVQHYVPPMGMGMRMGMEMCMSRPIMPFPSVLVGSALPTSAATAHLGPRFPMPAFHMPAVPLPTPLRIQATNQSDPMLNSIGTQNSNQLRQPNFADAYQQYPGLHQMQVQLPQNQATMQPSSSSSKDVETHENPEPG